MKVTFWGTRGSLPRPQIGNTIQQKIIIALRNAAGVDLRDEEAIQAFVKTLPFAVRHTFGGNTPCVQISEGEDYIIFDAGTGLQSFNLRELKKKPNTGNNTYHIIMSHTHWDHIMGFPFFTPAYIPGNTIEIHGVHPQLRERFENQMEPLHFPVSLEDMGAQINFHKHEIGEVFQIDPFEITSILQTHPGDSYGYKISSNGRVIVYATDAEYKNPSGDHIQPYVDFLKNADLLIFDAMYTLEEAVEKENFGHSNPIMGICLAVPAKVKTLALFHHNMECTDEEIYQSYLKAKEYAEFLIGTDEKQKLDIVSSYDNLILEV